MATDRELIGSLVVVGITYVDRDGNESRYQLAGSVEKVDDEVIEIRLQDGSTFTLPPAPEAFQPAEAGAVYTLASTGEQINSPAFLATFTVDPPEPESVPKASGAR